MEAAEVNAKIAELRKKGSRVLTNSYGHYTWDIAIEAYFSEDSLVLVDVDNGVHRIFFYTVNADDLIPVIYEMPDSVGYCLEIVSKNRDEYKELLLKSGFEPLAFMMRMANPDIGELLNSPDGVMRYFNSRYGIRATREDAHAINDVFWKVFDTRVSHLLSDELLKQVIDNEQVIVERFDNQIKAILQYQKEPRKFYINQIYNRMQREVIHSILIKELQEYYKNGGKYLYAWVQEDNLSSVKFHSKYGMVHDGLWNIVYVRENANK